jgi:hypothetical protein
MSSADWVHAPKYSLWLGMRLGLLFYGGAMFQDPNTGDATKTGQYVSNGVALEADVGARIAHRYIPYLGLELGLVSAGSDFNGTGASAGTSFLGIGFRFLAGDANAVSFASDISFGFRKFEVTESNQTWSASTFEFLRLGLGADIRFTSYFTISPMVTFSAGTLTDASGSLTGPTPTPAYVNGGQIPGPAQAGYYSIVLGCGAHFDLFGK